MESVASPPSAAGHRRSGYAARAPDLQTVLDALADPTCRTLLRATGSSPMTVRELADACDLPLSTAYRKVETLVDASLLRESVRICDHGKHSYQYERSFGGVFVHTTEDGSFDSISFDSASGWLLAVGEGE